MKHKLLFLFFLLFGTVPNLWAGKVLQINVKGAINVVTAEFIQESIIKAQDQKAECLIIQLNTPGGLLDAARSIVGHIMASSVPIVVYVAPGGAHAGSAGVFITVSADIAAMAPGTNIGAAHPVTLFGDIDSVMSIKIMNDASAFIRTIAENRNKNWQWAVDAVQKSNAISEKQALDENVIDLIAQNRLDLLNKIDGTTLHLNNGKMVSLNTKNAEIEELEMGAIDQMLDFLNDPNVMYVLFLIGIFCVVFELFNPGAILPGVAGVIALVLAFYSMSTLPVNYAGAALIIFAVILFVLEIKIISHGMLGLGGVVSLLIGSLMLIRKDPSFDVVSISNWVIFTSVILTSFLFLIVIYMGLKAQKKMAVTGSEGMLEETGIVLKPLEPTGLIRLHGEIWTAESLFGPIAGGTKVRIVKIVGLKAFVEPLIKPEN